MSQDYRMIPEPTRAVNVALILFAAACTSLILLFLELFRPYAKGIFASAVSVGLAGGVWFSLGRRRAWDTGDRPFYVFAPVVLMGLLLGVAMVFASLAVLHWLGPLTVPAAIVTSITTGGALAARHRRGLSLGMAFVAATSAGILATDLYLSRIVAVAG